MTGHGDPGGQTMVMRVATRAGGQIRVNCAGEPVQVSLCHCRECQKRTGSPYQIAAFFARSEVRTDGAFRTFRRGSDSGFAVSFHFCPDWSTVFWEPERKPDADCFGHRERSWHHLRSLTMT